MSIVVSDHLLDINDYNEVNTVCQEFSFKWEEIGSKLGIKRYAIEAIIVNKDTCQKRMSALIVEWLKREDAKQPLPSWRLLCNAIATVDRTNAERIAEGHQCDCTKCKADCLTTKSSQVNSTVCYDHKRSQKNPKTPLRTDDMLREYHSDICDILNTSDTTLHTFTTKLFARKIISKETKIDVIRRGGQKGADILLDHIKLKVERNPKLLNVVLEVMECIEELNGVATEINQVGAKRVQEEAGNLNSTQAVARSNGRSQTETSKSTIQLESTVSNTFKDTKSFLGLSITIIIIAIFVGWKIYKENSEEKSWTIPERQTYKVPQTKFPSIEERIWTAGETGREVVEACVRKLQESDIFCDDKKFMRRIAFVMSRDGNPPFQLQSDGGIWQVSQFAFRDTKDDTAHVRLPKKYRRLQEKFGIKHWKYVTRKDLEIPMYSAIAARLYLSNFAEPIPPAYNINMQDRYWWNFYMRNHKCTTFIHESDFLNAMGMLEE